LTGSVITVISEDESTSSGFIRDKKGNFTIFSHPDTTTSTNARAINNKGIVSGFAATGVPFPFSTVGFTYDPKTDTFTDIIPTSVRTIAHGINSKGDSVGNSFFLAADDPCGDGPDFVGYSWLHTADGNVTYFTVNGESTRARGINDSGKIAGFIFVAGDPNGPARGFVVELDGSQCQEITVAASDLLVNDLGFEDTIPEGISNSGDVVGNIGGEFSSHGFIARKK